MKRKILVIGLDGGEPSLIFKWAKEGKLPNIQRLIAGGVSGKLKSTIPPQSPSAWASFMTGKNPGKHGVFGFQEYDFSGYQPRNVISYRSIKSRIIWEILGDENKRVGILNVPMTYPPRRVNGFMVSGFMTPGEDVNFTYPEELASDLLEKFNYRIIDNRKLYLQKRYQEYIQDLYDILKIHGKAIDYLLQRYDWDFFMYVFQGVDRIQHRFWNSKEIIMKYYQEVDDIIGKMIKDIDEDTNVIMLSDHGFCSHEKFFNVNNWLQKNGFLMIKEELKSSEGARSIISRLGLNRENIYNLLLRLNLYSLVKKIPRRIKKTIPGVSYSLSDVDWNKTRAYSNSIATGQIFINLKGREPEGIVEPGEGYEAIRNEIIEKIQNFKDPENGERIVEKIFRREEIYNGAYLENAPDLTILTKDGYDAGVFGQQIFDPSIRCEGTHSLNGFFIISGSDIKKNKSMDAEIIDLTPTILYLMDIPVSRDIDGKILVDSIENGYVDKNPVKYRDVKKEEIKEGKKDVYSKEEEEEIKERLKALGYLD